MMDYLIAVGVAIAGILVVFVIFSSISSAEVTIVEEAREATGTKRSRKASKRQKDAPLDRETEALLAQELAKPPQGMGKDTSSIEPQTLEQMRHRRQAEVEAKRSHFAAEEATERQKLIDRELGFRHVDKAQKAPKEDKPRKEEEAPAPGSNDLVERMLHTFFSNQNEGRKFHSGPADSGKDRNAAPAGGRVTVKGEIGTRTWSTNEN